MKTSMALMLAATLVALDVAADDLQADLLAREQSMWQGWIKHDTGPFHKYGAQDYSQINADGRLVGSQAVSDDIVNHKCTLKAFELHDASLQHLTPDVVVLFYQVSQDETCSGTPMPAKLWNSSIYVLRDGAWMNTTYQDTPVK